MAAFGLSAELVEVLRAFNQVKIKISKGVPCEPAFKPGEADVIAYIHRFSDGQHGVNPSRIGEHLGLSRPAVTAVLNSLQEKGCIERRLCSTDRRMFEIFLTPDSRRDVDRMIQELDARVSRVIRELGERDSAELIRLLTRVVEIVANDELLNRKSK